jgi:putative aldouronate transport system permease protein
MGVSLIITFIGTFLSVLFSSLTAYPLSRRYLQHRSQISAMIVFTMIFSGGMIPSFLVVRSLGLYNTIWALIIPGCISAYNMIIMKNFFSRIPDEMEEAARIDGAGNMRILFQIYLPLSTAILATIALFYAVGYWNNYFNAIMYIKNPRLQPIQVILRQIVILSQGGLGDSSVLDAEIVLPPPTVKMAVIVFATAPILAIYPFLQKYFTKGALLGSVKS